MIKVPKKALTFDGHCVAQVDHVEETSTWKAYTVNDLETKHTIRIAIYKDSGDIASVRFLGYSDKNRKIVQKPLDRS